MMQAGSGPFSPDQNVKEMKDFLLTYNRIVEKCFGNCAANFNTRDVTDREGSCVDRCMSKFMLMNQRIITTYVQLQTVKQQKMFEEAQKAMDASNANQTLPPPDGNTDLQPNTVG